MFYSVGAFEMYASPAVPVAEVATEVFQGPTSTLAAHSTSSLGRSQEETSWADNVMLGYANLAKAWNVAHSGGERVDPTLGILLHALLCVVDSSCMAFDTFGHWFLSVCRVWRCV